MAIGALSVASLLLVGAFLGYYHSDIAGSLRSLVDTTCGPQLTPAPRTESLPWSTSPVLWMNFQAKLAAEVAAAEAGSGYELVFYGDSITEEWRGTNMDIADPRFTDVPPVFKKYFGNYTSEVLAIGGDQTAHLQWRLGHGEIATQHPAKVAVLLIGTNDLGAQNDCTGPHSIVDAVEGTAKRVGETLSWIREKTPTTHIIVQAQLPRGSSVAPPEKRYAQPSEYSFANKLLDGAVKEYTLFDDHMHFIDCTEGFLAKGDELDPVLQPDGLHPSAEGAEVLAQCLSPVVDHLMHLLQGEGSDDGQVQQS